MAEITYAVRTGRYPSGKFWYSVVVHSGDCTIAYAPILVDGISTFEELKAYVDAEVTKFVVGKYGPGPMRRVEK